jgi:multidrug efflux pump subunit AcrA (membrane-fusion protein)
MFVLVARVNEYATGPAVIRAKGRMDLTANEAGTVASVEVVPGQKVSAGQLLVRFSAVDEAAEYGRSRREFELHLLKLLKSPADTTARQAVTSLRPQMELAKARLDHRTLRAPQAGVITDVRIRPGQALARGDTALVFSGQNAVFQVVAALPGHYLPMLKPGMPLRLELEGFRYSYQALTIDSLETQVIGPAEVRRFLGQEQSDAVKLDGPLVLVQGQLRGGTFTSDGSTYTYYDGMHAKAQAKVRSSRLIALLAPWLKVLEGYGH